MDRDPDSEKSGYTANSYIAVLNDQMPRIWEPSRISMQDNAKIHTAKIIKKWFENESIPLVEWPPYSPDLNPIEHLWAVLKQWIHEHYPDLVDMGKSKQAYQRFFQAIREGWEAIGQEAINDLIKSMGTWVNAVIHAEGWYTRF
jgi:transposase